MSDDPFDASSPSWIHSSLLVTFGIRLASILAGLFCIFGGILYAKQDSLLYFPSITGSRSNANNPRGYRHPKERGIEAEDCAIVCADGTRIHAWLLLFNTNGPTILFFHGNAGNIGLRLPNAVQMRNQLQVNVMLVEYRGYGDSDNVAPTETGLKLDGEAALQFALQHPSIDPSKLFLFGRSLGGAVAVHAADYARRHQLPLAGVALENTFLSISAMVDHLMPYLTPIKPLVLNIHWDSSKLIGQLQVPLLFLCGGADELVPPQHMQHLVLLANRSVLKQVHVVQGGTHNECWMQGGAAYWDAMRAFVQQATSHNYAATTTTTTSSSSSAAGPATSSIPIMSSDLLGMAVGAQGGKSSSTRDKKKE